MKQIKRLMSMEEAFGICCAHAATISASFHIWTDDCGNGFYIELEDGLTIATAIYSAYNYTGEGLRPDIDEICLYSRDDVDTPITP